MRPENLVAGEVSRLIPAVSESNKEIRLLSPVLAALRISPDYAKEILDPLGVRLGRRAKISCFSEIKFVGDEFKSERPDGLILVETGGRKWSALVEAKYGKNKLDEDQVNRYLKLAKECNVDALITISNQFTATPMHNPISVAPKFTKKVDLYHLSWSQIRTRVHLLLDGERIEDEDHILILDELKRYLEHPSSGIEGFSQMNSGWSGLAKRIRSGERIPISDEALLATASNWMEEQKDLCLILSKQTGELAKLKLPKAYRNDQIAWQKSIAKNIAETSRLTAEIVIPNAAAPIDIDIRIAGRVVIAGMQLAAPQDRKSTSARVNWLIRQLPKTGDGEAIDDRLMIDISWPGRRQSERISLVSALTDKATLKKLDEGAPCNLVAIVLVDELLGKFGGSRTFIDGIEAAMTEFYKDVGQYLKVWQAPAPKSKIVASENGTNSEDTDQLPASGDGEFINIPDHLT